MRRKLLLTLFLLVLAPGYILAAKQNFFTEVDASVTKSNLYPNEQTLLAYTLFTRVDLRYEGFKKEPAFPFQWFEKKPFGGSVETKNVTRKGLKAVSAVVQETAVFPMRPGNYTLTPGTINTTYKTNPEQKERINDFIPLNPINVTVREFPKGGKPEDFNGFTGKFSLTSVNSLKKENEGDYILLNLQVAGEGNVRQIPLPIIDLPQGLSIDHIQEEVNVKWEKGVVKGVKKFSVKIRPEKAGSFKIPAPHLSYFEADSETYRSIMGQAFQQVILELPKPVPGFDIRKSEGNKINILFDISSSMLAKDFKPQDRISIAKQSLKDLLINEKMRSNLTQLITFAREPHEVWPLGPDNKEHLDLLNTIETAKINEDGTAIGSAIYEAIKNLEDIQFEKGKRFILLITDGSVNAGYIDSITAAHFAAEKSIPIYCIGIGKGGKVSFPIKDKDFGDREIEAEVDIDTQTLEQISRITHGKSFVVKNETDFKLAVQELSESFRYPK